MINSGRFGGSRPIIKRLTLALVIGTVWLTSRVQAAPLHQGLVVGQVQVHGICSDCMQALYPEIYRKRQQDKTT